MATSQLEKDWRDKQWTKAQQELFNRVLLTVLLIGMGVWIGSLLFAGDTGYGTNIYTELLSIAVTVGLLNYLGERRALRQYKEQLVRNVGSRANDTAVSAVDEIRKRRWLTDDDDEQLLQGADLQGADLRGADLRNADLSGSKLWGANLSGAKLGSANLRGANLFNADLGNANLSKANLSDATLPSASLIGADLRNANLNGAKLEFAKLDSAILIGANLSDANMQSASLSEVKLWGANLSGAKLGSANLRGANLNGVLFSEDTKLPDYSKWSTNLTMTDLSDRFGILFDAPIKSI